jgi:4-amino-4-deoxy-L-arabinose transferase-like glycosyltransferase
LTLQVRWGSRNGQTCVAMTRWLTASTRRRLPVCLFLLAFFVRAGFVLTLEDRLYWPDERDFVNIALGLAHGDEYLLDPKRANPALSFFLASIYQLVGFSYLVARLVQSVIGALTISVVFALTERLFNRRVALLAALGAALYPPLIYICGVFYVECLFTTLLALSVYLLYVSTQARGLHFLILLMCTSFVIGITVLCRPIFLVFLPFAVFFIMCSYPLNFTRKIACAMALVMMTSLTILPWTLRNYNLYGRVLLVATGSGLFLWRGNNELARGDTDDRYLNPGAGDAWLTRLQELPPTAQSALIQKYSHVQIDLQGLDQIDQDHYLQRLALAFMREHPAQSLALFVQKVRTLYTAFTQVRPEHREFIKTKQRLVLSLIFYPALVFAFLGVVLTIPQWRKYLILYLPILSLTFAYGLLTSASRFRIPFEPFIIIFTAYGGVVLFDHLHAAWYVIRHKLSRNQFISIAK